MSQTTAQLLGPVKNNVTGDIIFDSHTLFVDESTNRVGVNTSSPTTPLHVSGNVAFGDGGGFDMNVLGTRWQFSINGSERLRIASNGQIGMGKAGAVTPNGNSPLTIQESDSNSETICLRATNSGGNGSQPGIVMKTAANVHIGGIYCDVNSDYMRISTSGNDRMYITNTGNVGINRSNPDQKLSVSGNIEVNAYDNAGGSGGYYTQKGLIIGNLYDAGKSYTGGDDRTACIWQERGLDLDFATNDTYRMKLTYDGKLIISNTQRPSPFIVGDGGLCIEQTYDGLLNAICIRNKDTNLSAATAINFSLNRSGGDQDFEGGRISLHKEQQWTTSSSTVGGQLKFSTIYQGTLRGRITIGGAGLMSNTKGGASQYSGGTILGTYKYVQSNQGNGHSHNILGPDGRNLNVYLNNNVGAHIYIKVTGTGTMSSYCEYYYENNSSVAGATLTHLRGNNGASSNRPYMGLTGQIPYWTMSHSGAYTIDVRVQMMGGRTYSSYFQAGETAFTSNP